MNFRIEKPRGRQHVGDIEDPVLSSLSDSQNDETADESELEPAEAKSHPKPQIKGKLIKKTSAERLGKARI